LEKKDILISGNQCKALYIATTDFYKHNFPIEMYSVNISYENDFFKIHYCPHVDDWEEVNWGRPDFGSCVIYLISKETFAIEKKTLSR